jgi:hypothetical protein
MEELFLQLPENDKIAMNDKLSDEEGRTWSLEMSLEN